MAVGGGGVIVKEVKLPCRWMDHSMSSEHSRLLAWVPIRVRVRVRVRLGLGLGLGLGSGLGLRVSMPGFQPCMVMNRSSRHGPMFSTPIYRLYIRISRVVKTDFQDYLSHINKFK